MLANALRAAPFVMLASLVCGLLTGCDEGGSAQKKNETLLELVKRETTLMADPESAGPDLERRLDERVSVNDGLLLVKDNAIGLSVLPATTPWTLQCGFAGMSIAFGNGVAGDTAGVSNDVTVELSFGKIDQINCAVLGPRIGKRLQVMIRSPFRDQ